jgi:carbonic anhydrase/acetyltransferase-like protein (isoleucine patch superfamily)
MLGVRIGRRVFDDGCSIPEKTLVTIGDDAILNAGSIIQCHSLEDGAFKSGHTVLGAGVTLGPRTFVHYGVRIEDNAVIDTDSFLMKGEQVGAGTLWAGNPAVQTGTVTVAPAPLPANLEAALVTTAPVPNPIETPLTEPTTPDAETMLARINALEQALAELRTATRPDAGELLLAGDSTRSEK